MEKEVSKKSADINRQEIEESRESINNTHELIDKAVELAREINSDLCLRDLDPNDKRKQEAIVALGYAENVIESLSLIIGYDLAAINIDRVVLEKD